MRKNNKYKIFIVIAVIAILAFITAFADGFLGLKDLNDRREGIDIKGGVYTVLYPELPNGGELNPDTKSRDLLSAKKKIQARLDAKGIFDASVTIEEGKGRLILEIPYKADDKDFNPQSVIDELGKTALLTFRELNEEQYAIVHAWRNNLNPDLTIEDFQNVMATPSDLILVEGKNVEDAKAATQNDSFGKSENVISLTFDAEGKELFAAATQRLVGNYIAIYIDDLFIMVPGVNTAITDGKAVITGGYTYAEASEQAAVIKAGALPFRLVAKEIRSISPTLGKGALDITVRAGIIAFFLVFLYMLLYYRLPGLLANIALFGLVVLELFVILQFGITITLPGIAGIILSVGMGVDANIIITERIREELRTGKTLKASIDIGFKRAMSAIVDANITTIISGGALFIFGTGPIKGFALTLIIGVVLSFITALIASRVMLKSIACYEFAKNKWFYGIKEGGQIV